MVGPEHVMGLAIGNELELLHNHAPWPNRRPNSLFHFCRLIQLSLEEVDDGQRAQLDTFSSILFALLPFRSSLRPV